MPNFKIYNSSPSKLKALAHSENNSGTISLKSDPSGNLYVKTLSANNEPESLPYTAFGELRVAQLKPQAGWNFSYSVNPDIIISTTATSGSITQSSGKAVLQTTTTSNSTAAIETRDVLRYVPGEGGLIRFTAIFTTGVAGTKQVIGYGDDTDGFFFGYNGSSFGVLRRQNGSENWVAQTAWNGDKFNGSGTSGVTLDPTKGNVYSIRFQWLGFGAIEFYIENPSTGEATMVHRMAYANANDNPSIYNPSLPLSAKVLNSGISSNIVLQTTSAMGFIEGISENVLETINSQTVSKADVSDERAIFSIKNISSFQGKTNRVRVKVGVVSSAADGTRNAQLRLVRNVNYLSGSSGWTNISSGVSVVQYDTGISGFSGGRTLMRWTVGKYNSDSIFFVPDSVPVIISPGETLTFAASSHATAEFDCSLTWLELF